MFDLDNDGDLDIVTNDFNSAPQVLISDLAQKKNIHWLKVVLVGTHSNRNGLARPCAYILPAKPIRNTTMGNRVTCRKAFFHFTSDWGMPRMSSGSKLIGLLGRNKS